MSWMYTIYKYWSFKLKMNISLRKIKLSSRLHFHYGKCLQITNIREALSIEERFSKMLQSSKECIFTTSCKIYYLKRIFEIPPYEHLWDVLWEYNCQKFQINFRITEQQERNYINAFFKHIQTVPLISSKYCAKLFWQFYENISNTFIINAISLYYF